MLKLISFNRGYYKSANGRLQNNSVNGAKWVTINRVINTDIFAFIAVLVFKLLSLKVLLINRKVNSNC